MDAGDEPVMRCQQKESRRLYRLLALPAIVLLLLFFILPLLYTLSNAFISPEGRITFAPLKAIFTDAYTLRVMRFTLTQAALSTIVSLLVALPGAYLLSTYSFRGKRIIFALTAIPFVIPSILVVLGFVIFFGNNGYLNLMLMRLFGLSDPPLKILYSYKAIILAHTFYNFPIIMNLVATYALTMDRRIEAAAATLGASRWQIFFTVTLPRLLPAIISAASLVFLFCFSSFAIILVLGGGPQYTTMEVEIYRQARMMGNAGAAAALSLFSILVTTLLLLTYNRSQTRSSQRERFSDLPLLQGRPATNLGRLAAILYTLTTLLFVLAPILSVMVRSVRAPQGFTLKWYRQLLGFELGSSHMNSALTALINSVVIGVIVSAAAVTAGVGFALYIERKRRGKAALEILGMLSMTVSSVIIGLGYFLIATYLRGGLTLSYILVVIAHLIIALPFTLRSLLPAYRKIPCTYVESARTLGSTPLHALLRIELPLLKGAIGSATIFAFALSMGEFNATLTLSSASIVTLPMVIYRLIGSYNYQGACALGTILIIVSALVFLVTTRTGGSHETN